jgi:hypothetical protein
MSNEVVLVVHMRSKYISGVFLMISLLLLCAFVSAVSFDEFSFHLDSVPKPPLALTGASIDSEEGVLIHDNVYQITVQVTNTRPHNVDGQVEVAAFSLLQSPIVLGSETVDLQPDENTSLLFTFSPTFPCANYIFMATTEPNSATHISERDYIFVDERREFVLAACIEEVEENEILDSTVNETSVAITTITNVITDSDNETKDEIERVLIPPQPMDISHEDFAPDLPANETDLPANETDTHLQPFTANIEANSTIMEE